MLRLSSKLVLRARQHALRVQRWLHRRLAELHGLPRGHLQARRRQRRVRRLRWELDVATIFDGRDCLRVQRRLFLSHFHEIDYFWKHQTSNSRLRHSI